jgi:hypothetical protein
MPPWLVTLLTIGAVLVLGLAAATGFWIGRLVGRSQGRLDAVRSLLTMKNPEAWNFAHCLFVDYNASTAKVMRDDVDAALEPRKEIRRDHQTHQ